MSATLSLKHMPHLWTAAPVTCILRVITSSAAVEGIQMCSSWHSQPHDFKSDSNVSIFYISLRLQ